MTCKRCSKYLSLQYKYCPQCGTLAPPDMGIKVLPISIRVDIDNMRSVGAEHGLEGEILEAFISSIPKVELQLCVTSDGAASIISINDLLVG